MKVLIADSQSPVRHALSVWISGQSGLEVIGESSDSTDLLVQLKQLLPEVVILDRDLPGIEIRALVKNIRQASKEVIIILLFNGPFAQFDSDPLDVDYYASKIDPPARVTEAILKARRRYESKTQSSEEGQDMQ